MATRRPKKLSVLLIPDDNAEPFSFRLNIRVVRMLILFLVILFVHVVAGGYSYWRWYSAHQENKKLNSDNAELLEDNKRVYVLQERFSDLNKRYARILGLLGVPGENGVSLPLKDIDASVDDAGDSRDVSDLSAGASSQPANRVGTKTGFLFPKKTNVHAYAPSLPTLLPVDGLLSNDFSHNVASLGVLGLGAAGRHPGIDIAGPRGTEIVAAGAGMIVFAGWTSKYGNIVIIHHGDDLFSYYAHNSKLLASDRMYVKKGDVIAQRGDSGSTSKGPHLHFEIWKDGKPVDPREYILAFQADNS